MIMAILDSFATGPTNANKVIKNAVHFSACPKRYPRSQNEALETQNLIKNMHKTLKYNNPSEQ
jgi:hypothetical protein